jgi:hypothetical protein
MSEHQYYEFQTVDRPLDKHQMGELRALSSRADITPTSFVNVYNYGDFRGDPQKLMEKYFDAFVYSANWGTRTVMLRIPRRLVEVEALEPYFTGEANSLRIKPEHVILEFNSNEEGGDWQEDDEEWLSSMLPLREDLIAGDLRCLYLGWLIGVQGDASEYYEDEEVEPPVPPGLRELSPALKSFADFLRIDADLIEVAAPKDTAALPSAPSREDLSQWIAALPASEKTALLLRVMEEDTPLIRRELLHRFRHDKAGVERDSAAEPQGAGRTVGQLRAAFEEWSAAKQRGKEARRAADQVRRDREKAEARAKHLDALAKRTTEAWKDVETLIATKLPKEYDKAVQLLVDLRDLAERESRGDETRARIQEVRGRHSRKPTFIERLRKAGLIG